MKKRALLFLFSLLTVSGLAQNLEEYVFHERYARTTAAAEQNHLTALGGAIYSCDQPVLYLLDEAGQERWSIIPYETGYGWIEDVYWESESTIVAAGTNYGADDVIGLPTDGWVLIRVDTAGNVLAERRMNPYFGNPPLRLRPLPDGRLLANFDNALFGFDDNLDSLFARTYDQELIDFQPYSDTSLVLLFRDYVLLTDLTGNISDTLPFPTDTYRAFAVTSAEVFTASNGLLHRYDRTNGVVSVSATVPPNLRVQRLFYQNGSIHLLADRQGSLETTLYRLEADSWIDEFPFPTPQRTITRLYPSDEGWLLLGQDFPETQGNPYFLGYFKKLPALDAYSPGPQDIAVTDLTFAQITNFTSTEQEPGLYWLRYDLALQMEVANNGSTTIDELVIGSLRQGGFNCAEGRFLQEHSGLTIPPGGAYTFDVSTSVFFYENTPSLPILELTPCFFATAPDHRLDATPLDNQLCQMITGEREAGALPNLQVFPNPAADVLYVQGEGVSDVENIYLYDSRGRLVRQAPANGRVAIEIYRHELPTGLYLLRLETRKVSLTRKVLFE